MQNLSSGEIIKQDSSDTIISSEEIQLDFSKYDQYLLKIIKEGGAPSLQEIKDAARPYSQTTSAKIHRTSHAFQNGATSLYQKLTGNPSLDLNLQPRHEDEDLQLAIGELEKAKDLLYKGNLAEAYNQLKTIESVEKITNKLSKKQKSQIYDFIELIELHSFAKQFSDYRVKSLRQGYLESVAFDKETPRSSPIQKQYVAFSQHL